MAPPLEAMSLRDFPRAWAAVREGVAGGVAPGMVLGFWSARSPGAAAALAHGQRRLLPSPQPLDVGTPFDLASLTKVLAGALVAARLVERGWLRWRTPVAALLPTSLLPGVELRHLLSHASGLTWWEPYYERLRERFGPEPGRLAAVSPRARRELMKELVLARAPEARPGERILYSDLNFLLLTFLCEEAAQLPWERLARRWVWGPIGAEGLHYRPVVADVAAGRDERFAATEDCPWRGGVLQGQVHDDNAWAMGGVSAHAGAFGTVADVLAVARGLLTGFLPSAVLEPLWARVAEPAGGERTWGWDVPSGPTPAAGRHFPPSRTVGHLGFTGTSLWIDRDARLAVALLTNRVHPSRTNEAIKAFRPRVHDALREDLAELGLAPLRAPQ